MMKQPIKMAKIKIARITNIAWTKKLSKKEKVKIEKN
jgi:hypothetical protein